MKKIEIIGKTIYAFEFINLAAAWSMVNRATKPQRIIMGDAPHYWVVNNADAQRLVAAGYEMV